MASGGGVRPLTNLPNPFPMRNIIYHTAPLASNVFDNCERFVDFSQSTLEHRGYPEAKASGWPNVFEPEPSRDGEGELFGHRGAKDHKLFYVSFDVKKSTHERTIGKRITCSWIMPAARYP